MAVTVDRMAIARSSGVAKTVTIGTPDDFRLSLGVVAALGAIVLLLVFGGGMETHGPRGEAQAAMAPAPAQYVDIPAPAITPPGVPVH